MRDQTVRSKLIRFRNFLSFGNEWTEIDLSQNVLTAILGENMDTGGENSRNGVGKSSIGDALSYAVFGVTPRPSMTNPQLINKLARRGQSMIVQYEFDKGDFSYMIERGEKPSLLNLYAKPLESDDSWETKAADGTTEKYNISKKRKEDTNADIQDLWGLDLTLAKYVVLNSTEDNPFPTLDAERRRRLFESLFNLKLLSKRAKELSEERKELNKNIIATESAITATKQANARVQTEIDRTHQRSADWETDRKNRLADLKNAIGRLENTDAESEIETLNLITDLTTAMTDASQRQRLQRGELRQSELLLQSKTADNERNIKRVEELDTVVESLNKATCPTCEQHWEPNPTYREEITHEMAATLAILESGINQIATMEGDIRIKKDALVKIESELAELTTYANEAAQTKLTYRSIEEAASAKSTLAETKKRLEEFQAQTNPHTESISSLSKDALQDIDETELVEMKLLLEHYKLLIDLLTNEDSFLRRSIMNECLPRLNQRIDHYLRLLELPHKVKIMPDLSMSITDYGQEFGWGGISRGQRQRVVVAMNFAFQDVFEITNHKINTLIVDELIDNGICGRGAQITVDVLKQMVRDKEKRILLITHREEIASQITDHMTVKIKNKQSWVEVNGEGRDTTYDRVEDY